MSRPSQTSPASDPAPTKQIVLSTQSVPETMRLEYWLEMVCSTYCHLDCEPPEHEAIFGDIRSAQVGAIHFSRVSSNCRQVRLTAERTGSSQDTDFLVLLQRKGRGAMHQDGRTAILEPGDFVFHACDRPYELEFEQPLHVLDVLRVARPHLEGHVANLDSLTALTVPGDAVAGRLLRSMLDTLHGQLDELHPSSSLGISEAITNVVAAGLRSLPDANLRQASNLASYHRARITAHVQEHLRDPGLSVNSIAAALQMSADHVSRMFRDEPMSLSRLIWQMRLDACRRDLGDPRFATRSVSDIAFSWGFNDAAHFSRSFRKQHGRSPREWRQLELSVPRGCALPGGG
jgi:AraC-like DNA-binding protein